MANKNLKNEMKDMCLLQRKNPCYSILQELGDMNIDSSDGFETTWKCNKNWGQGIEEIIVIVIDKIYIPIIYKKDAKLYSTKCYHMKETGFV